MIEKSEKKASRKLTAALFLIGMMFIIPLISAWTNDTFSNSLTSENLFLYNDTNTTRYLSIPQNTLVTTAYLNLSGYQYESLFTNFETGVIAPFSSGSITGEAINSTNSLLLNSDTVSSATFNESRPDYLRFNINLTKLDDGGLISVLLRQSGASGTAIQIVFYNGAMGYINSTSAYTWIGNVTEDRNFMIEARNINYSTKKYDIYVNGILNKSDALFRHNSNIIPTILDLDGQSGYPTKFDDILLKKTTTPTNFTLSINKTNVFQHFNNYNTINRTSNLASTLNYYLNDCNFISGYCLIPFNFYSSTDGGLRYFNMNFSSEGFLENSISFNSTTYETSTESFILNLSYDNNYYTSISANLIYNGTSYAGTKIGSGSDIQFTRSLGLNSVGNKSFYWQIGLTNSSGTTYYNSNTNYQNVLPVQLGLCNSTLNQTYLNITFKDETYDIYINASIPYSTFVYSLGDYSYNKTFILINASENPNYPICFSPVDKQVNIDAYFQYSAVGYPQRIYNPESITYTNQTTQKVLYLSSVGQTVSFQVINLALQVIPNVQVIATRIIGTETVVVGNGITNDAGIVSFWLNYNFQHNVLFEKDGYTSYNFVVTPVNTEYTIKLGGTSTTTNDYGQGITNRINPSNDFLDNNTIYNFNYTLTSNYWDVDEFGFSLYYANGTLIGSQTAYSNGGIINLNADTSNQSTIYMNYYYIIDSNRTDGSRTWIIQTKPSFGIWKFFQDLNRYTSLGFYGFDNFGKAILSILIILLIAGGLSARYGIASESAIMGLVFGIVLALDYNNFIPPLRIGNITPIDHFITFITFMIMIVMIIREER